MTLPQIAFEYLIRFIGYILAGYFVARGLTWLIEGDHNEH